MTPIRIDIPDAKPRGECTREQFVKLVELGDFE